MDWSNVTADMNYETNDSNYTSPNVSIIIGIHEKSYSLTFFFILVLNCPSPDISKMWSAFF